MSKKDIFTVVKSCSKQITEKCYNDEGRKLPKEEILDNVHDALKSTYFKQSFWWRVKNPFEIFKQLVIADLQGNFMGGAVLNKNGDTIIEIN